MGWTSPEGGGRSGGGSMEVIPGAGRQSTGEVAGPKKELIGGRTSWLLPVLSSFR